MHPTELYFAICIFANLLIKVPSSVDPTCQPSQFGLCSLGVRLYTTHAKSINSVVAKCENNLNIPINSIMLLSTYESIQSSQRTDSYDSIKSINQLKIYVDLFWEIFNFVHLFGIFWINSIDTIIPAPQSQSTQSPTLWKRIDSVTNQLTWERNWIDSINFAEKMNWFKSINSVEMIGKQVWSWEQPVHTMSAADTKQAGSMYARIVFIAHGSFNQRTGRF